MVVKEEDGNQGDGDVIEQIGVKWVNECGICMGVKKKSRIGTRKKRYERSTVDRQIKVPDTIARSVEHRYLEKHAVRKRESEGRKKSGKRTEGMVEKSRDGVDRERGDNVGTGDVKHQCGGGETRMKVV